jgi:diguanylate cyclase (GGDEF)-like protein
MTREGINQQASVIDSVTGVASIRTIIEHVVGYMQDYQINEKDFVFLLVEVPEYERIVRTYGQTVGDCLLQKVANVLTKNISLTGSVGRIYGATFAVVYRYEHREDVSEICYGIGEDIRGIHEVDGRPCTLFTKIGTVFGDEVKDLNEMSRLANDRKRMY